jgi:hypothetical protein
MLGDELSDQLGLQEMTTYSSIAIRLLCWLNKGLTLIQYYFQPFEKVMYRFGVNALENLVKITLKGKDTSYTLLTNR